MARRFDYRQFGAGSTYVQRGIAVEVAKSLDFAGDELGRSIGRWAKEYSKGLNGRGRQSLAHINKRVADEAQRIIINEYVTTNFVGEGIPYRQEEGRLPGSLYRALVETDLAKGSAEGILFLPMKKLDRKAKHWRRINFGTGGVSSYSNPVSSRGNYFARRRGFDLSRLQGSGGAIRFPKFPMFGAKEYYASSRRGTFTAGKNALYFKNDSRKDKQRRVGIKHFTRPGLAKQFGGHHFIEKGAEYLTDAWPVAIEDFVLQQGLQALQRVKSR